MTEILQQMLAELEREDDLEQAPDTPMPRAPRYIRRAKIDRMIPNALISEHVYRNPPTANTKRSTPRRPAEMRNYEPSLFENLSFYARNPGIAFDELRRARPADGRRYDSTTREIVTLPARAMTQMGIEALDAGANVLAPDRTPRQRFLDGSEAAVKGLLTAFQPARAIKAGLGALGTAGVLDLVSSNANAAEVELPTRLGDAARARAEAENRRKMDVERIRASAAADANARVAMERERLNSAARMAEQGTRARQIEAAKEQLRADLQRARSDRGRSMLGDLFGRLEPVAPFLMGAGAGAIARTAAPASKVLPAIAGAEVGATTAAIPIWERAYGPGDKSNPEFTAWQNYNLRLPEDATAERERAAPYLKPESEGGLSRIDPQVLLAQQSLTDPRRLAFSAASGVLSGMTGGVTANALSRFREVPAAVAAVPGKMAAGYSRSMGQASGAREAGRLQAEIENARLLAKLTRAQNRVPARIPAASSSPPSPPPMVGGSSSGVPPRIPPGGPGGNAPGGPVGPSGGSAPPQPPVHLPPQGTSPTTPPGIGPSSTSNIRWSGALKDRARTAIYQAAEKKGSSDLVTVDDIRHVLPGMGDKALSNYLDKVKRVLRATGATQGKEQKEILDALLDAGMKLSVTGAAGVGGTSFLNSLINDPYGELH